jgi:hypothetical protein
LIAKTQTGRFKLLSALRHSAVVVAAVFLVSAGGLGVEIVFKNREAATLELRNLELNQQILATQGELARANRLASTNVPSDLGAVGTLQSTIKSLADGKHCSVVEFRASNEVTPYLTRFAKTNSVSGWGQVNVQISISGKAKNVVATLTGLSDKQIPFEFDSLEITRDKVNEVGDATVIGHATLRVLIRTPKESA